MKALPSALLTMLLASAVASAETAAGYAIAIGGALRHDNDAVWSRIVQLAGGHGARFVVFATAADDPHDAAARIVTTLQRHGAVATHIPVAPRIDGIDLADEVRSKKWIDEVRRARGVYFTGGSQERIVDTLQPRGVRTPLLDAIWDVYHAGGVVAGSSAGAAIMSATMFRDAPEVLSVMRGEFRQGREIDRGLGFVGPALFVDQHFLARGRIGRMLPVMTAKTYMLGLGVEEDSAAIVHGKQIEVIGAEGALFVDLRGASHGAAGEPLSIRAARLTYLGPGDRIDLATRELTPAPAKTKHRIDWRAPDFSPYHDDAPFFMQILGPGTLLAAMTNLLDSPLSEVRGLAYDLPRSDAARAEPGFEFRLYKGVDTIGWFTSASGGEDYTVANVYLDVTPVRVAQPFYLPWRTPGATPVTRP